MSKISENTIKKYIVKRSKIGHLSGAIALVVRSGRSQSGAVICNRKWLNYLKFQLMITTVTRMDTVFMMNVNNRYLAMSGRTSDVGGRIFDTSKRNTTSDSRILIPRVTFSPASAGK